MPFTAYDPETKVSLTIALQGAALWVLLGERAPLRQLRCPIPLLKRAVDVAFVCFNKSHKRG